MHIIIVKCEIRNHIRILSDNQIFRLISLLENLCIENFSKSVKM